MIKVKKEYSDNGNILYESHYSNGRHHREDGPAHIKYYPDGNIEHKEYYLNNNELTEQEWFNQLSIENKLKIAFGMNND
jgi:antitoxin component YwqK of YwqJK toxin-antitoxin module